MQFFALSGFFYPINIIFVAMIANPHIYLISSIPFTAMDITDMFAIMRMHR